MQKEKSRMYLMDYMKTSDKHYNYSRQLHWLLNWFKDWATSSEEICIPNYGTYKTYKDL